MVEGVFLCAPSMDVVYRMQVLYKDKHEYHLGQKIIPLRTKFSTISATVMAVCAPHNSNFSFHGANLIVETNMKVSCTGIHHSKPLQNYSRLRCFRPCTILLSSGTFILEYWECRIQSSISGNGAQNKRFE